MEDRVSETLDLRPYPRIDPPPEPHWTGLWWLLAAFIVALLILWWLRRSKRPPQLNPEDRLNAVLATVSDITTDSTKRYAQLHEAFRAYLAWRYHPRWRAVTSAEWELFLADFSPGKFDEYQLALLRSCWVQGDYVQFGQGTATEEQVQRYGVVIKEVLLKASSKTAENEGKKSASPAKQT